MKTTIRRWGHSLAVRIPRNVAQETSLGAGDEVEMRTEDDGIVVGRPQVKAYRLSDLMDRVTKTNRHSEVDWGKSAGGEVW
jgi:antitoxin MazE